MCILSVRLLRCGSCRSFYHDRACGELGHGLVWEREQWWASGAVGAVRSVDFDVRVYSTLFS